MHVSPPEFETHYPYCDTELGGYQQLTMSISVTFPAIAKDKHTGKMIALTTTEYEDLILSYTPLYEQESTITRARDCISFDFDYVYDDLTIKPDSTYCEYPSFPTRPVRKTQ